MKLPSLLGAIAPFPSVVRPILVKMKGYPFHLSVSRQIKQDNAITQNAASKGIPFRASLSSYLNCLDNSP